MNAQRCHDLRLTGSGGANRVMEAELKRLVMRSPFDVRLDKPKREGEEALLYAFDARAAWVAALRAACFVANPKFVYAFGHRATMTKPASNANLRGTFLVFQL